MDEMIEKVKRALRLCMGSVVECYRCEYYGEGRCPEEKNRDMLTVITLLEEQNKELREANEKLLEQLKAARELGQNGVPPMPCKVGDTMWAVFKSGGVISVEKTECQEILWDGEDWLIGDDGCCWQVPDGEALFLSIEAAVKKAEEMLRNENV